MRILTLSGGGFRATLFHLGVIRFLAEQGLLSKCMHIFSDSGGSALAAHLLQHWVAYTKDSRQNNLPNYLHSRGWIS